MISSTSSVLVWIEGNLTHILWLKYKNDRREHSGDYKQPGGDIHMDLTGGGKT